MKKKLVFVFMMVTLVLALVGCDDSDDNIVSTKETEYTEPAPINPSSLTWMLIPNVEIHSDAKNFITYYHQEDIDSTADFETYDYYEDKIEEIKETNERLRVTRTGAVIYGSDDPVETKYDTDMEFYSYYIIDDKLHKWGSIHIRCKDYTRNTFLSIPDTIGWDELKINN